MIMKYDQKPGFLVDLFFTFCLDFMKENEDGFENFINPKKRSADMKYFSDCRARFDDAAPELCVFFSIAGKQSFAFTCLFRRAVQQGDYSVDGLQVRLPNSAVMKEELLRFYLPECAESELTVEELTDRIRSLMLDEAVKYHLLSAVLYPEPYYALLFDSLRKREPKLQQVYDERADFVQQAIESADRAFIKEFISQRYALKENDPPVNTIVSGMLIDKNAIRLIQDDARLLLLGYDYVARMKILIGQSIKPDIIKMGKALSEEKRVQILRMLLVEKEITAQQLLTRLKLSMTATHYHLEMLLQAGMLLTRNEGRTIFYSLNRTYFDRAPIVFEEFAHAE